MKKPRMSSLSVTKQMHLIYTKQLQELASIRWPHSQKTGKEKTTNFCSIPTICSATMVHKTILLEYFPVDFSNKTSGQHRKWGIWEDTIIKKKNYFLAIFRYLKAACRLSKTWSRRQRVILRKQSNDANFGSLYTRHAPQYGCNTEHKLTAELTGNKLTTS